MSETEKKAKPIRCIVTSDKMNKSRVGTVERLVKHDRYGRFRRRRTKLMFHDEQNTTQTGDHVLVTVSKPHSKNKKFTLLEVLRKAKV